MGEAERIRNYIFSMYENSDLSPMEFTGLLEATKLELLMNMYDNPDKEEE